MPVPEEDIGHALLASVQAPEGKLRSAIVASLVNDGITDALEQAQFIEIIIALIPVLLPLILECFKTPEEAARAMNNPGWFQRKRLWDKVEKEIPDRKGDSRAARRENEAKREVLYAAVLAAAKKVTAEDVKALSA